MSALALVPKLALVPRLWAVADNGPQNPAPTRHPGSNLPAQLKPAQLRLAQPKVDQPKLSPRKGPHRLRLVQASACPRAAKQPHPQTQAPPAGNHPRPELAFYRKYTEAMLRRYGKLSLESGRVPSLMGRQELFAGHASHYRVSSFEDVVIYTHDVDRCLKDLSPVQKLLLRRVAVQQYTQSETAAMLGLSLRTTIRTYTEAVDRLTALFLGRQMLQPLTAAKA